MPAPITLTCRLAVAGHTYFSRTHDPAEEIQLRDRVVSLVDTVLGGIRSGAQQAVQKSYGFHPSMVDPQPQAVLLSSLAPGTDQLVAERAIQAQFQLATILPRDVKAYAAVMNPAAAAGLHRLSSIAHSPRRLELDEPLPPGNSPVDEEIRQQAYKVAGHVVLQNADFLLAVYDDHPQRPTNSGGTTEMVRRAKEAGIPTIWIHPVKDFVQVGLDVANRFNGEAMNDIESAVAELVCRELSLVPDEVPLPLHAHPHEAKRQRKQRRKELRAMQLFFTEDSLDECHWCWKSLVSAWNHVDWLCSAAKPHHGHSEKPRTDFVATTRMVCQQADDRVRDVEQVLGEHRDRVDNLSIHYAGLHRASVLFIYLLGVGAVFFAGCAGMPHGGHGAESPHGPAAAGELIFGLFTRSAWFCGLELLCLLAGLWLFLLNRFGCWHERSTDYRLLTERLRHAAALSVLGRATWQYAYEPLPAHYSEHNPRSGWVDRVYRALVREAVLPIGLRNLSEPRRDYVRACRRYLVRKYVGAQAKYHRRNAAKLHRQHVALEIVAYGALVATFLACGAHFLIHHPALTVCATTFPAIVAACHGLSAHFHLQRVLQRSEAMERYLEVQGEKAPRLSPPQTSHALAEWAEQSAIRMLQEADEWRVVFRLLNVPTPG